MYLKFDTLAYGLVLAGIDVLAFPFVKYVRMGLHPMWMIVPVFLYAIDPFILLQSLKIEQIAIMNLVWNLMSNILITCMGVLVFQEAIPLGKWIGILLSMVSILLMTYEGSHMSRRTFASV